MARVRALEAEKGITRQGVEAMRDELIGLARHASLFSREDFPPPAPGADDNNRLYLISEETDRRFALYVQSSQPGVDVPPHNHTTWAVIVGLEGIEENRFYARGENGADRTGGLDVGPETGVAFLPDDLHSIHIHGAEPVVNFHMYGLALDQLHEREYWSTKHCAWRIFPPQQNIIDRRSA
jgi:predicted metal-dependent enzyme (double-stranded beta helix superfamily)